MKASCSRLSIGIIIDYLSRPLKHSSGNAHKCEACPKTDTQDVTAKIERRVSITTLEASRHKVSRVQERLADICDFFTSHFVDVEFFVSIKM
jgi:hypothetical protein